MPYPFARSNHRSCSDERELGPGDAVGRSEALRLLHPGPEALRGGPQLELGVGVQPPGDVDTGEQHVAELGRGAGVGRVLGRRLGPDLGAQLGQLLVEVAERAGQVRVVEADCGRAALSLSRQEERRQVLGNVVEDARAALLLDLEALPVLAHAAGRVRLGVAEDVRMARDELRVRAAGHLLEIARPTLGQELCEEIGLEEQVAELVEQLRVVACEGGVGDLVGLLDRVRHDRLLRLRAVPRAVAAQALGQPLELDQRVVKRGRLRGHYVVAVLAVDVSAAHGSGDGWKPAPYLICEPLQ